MTSTGTLDSKPLVPQRSLLLIFFLATAVIYIALSETGLQGPWMAGLKILPIATLAVLASSRLDGLTRTLALVALAFSALGDVFLDLDFPNQFVFGLGAFLLAQLTYAVNFLRYADFRNRRSLLRGVPVVIGALVLAAVMLPDAGELAPAVMVYLLAILLMVVSAAAHRGDSALLFAGALSFMISDALIGLNRFVTPVPLAGIAVMVTYYGAQLMLILGLSHLKFWQAR